jgi:hypothetical protein
VRLVSESRWPGLGAGAYRKKVSLQKPLEYSHRRKKGYYLIAN